MKINPLYLHLLLGFFVVIVVTLLSIRTVLVTSQYTPLSFLRLVNMQTYRALRNAPVPQVSTPIYLQKNTVITTQDGTTVTAVPENATDIQVVSIEKKLFLQYKIATEFFLYDLEKESTLSWRVDGVHPQVLGYLNPQIVVIADEHENSHWTVRLVTIQKNGSTVSKNMEFDSRIKPLFDSETATLSYVICTPFCNIHVHSIGTQTEVASIPAFSDASYAASLESIELLFVDPVAQLVGYKKPDNEIYVTQFDVELLQSIRLENERNKVVYLGYFPKTKQMAFVLEEKSGLYKQLALYAADRPSLHLLQKVSMETSISVNEASNSITVGKDLVDLSGKIVSSLGEQTLISGQ